MQSREDRRDADAGWPSRKTSVNVVPPPRPGQTAAAPEGDEDEAEAKDAFAPLVDASSSDSYSDGKKITSNDVEKYMQAREAQMRSN